MASLHTASKLAQAAGNCVDEGWALAELGTANAQFGHTRKAVDYHRQALARFRQQDVPALADDQVLRLAGALAVAGQFTEAVKTLVPLQRLSLARGELITAVRAGVSLDIVALMQGNVGAYLEGLRAAMALLPEKEGRMREGIQRAIDRAPIQAQE